ncbi:MAG: TRAP transporter small permease [Bauldia sp.]|nr:MAG: TRAP transporter small permease [Bauldia sp.]MBZ0228498.1 TRAP transporter small permease [Bauldia sp.]
MAVGLFVAMFVAFLLQIFTRYVLNHPLGWTLEACVILYIWIVFWTSAFLLRERDHVAFTMLCDAVAPGARRVFAILGALAIGGAFVAGFPAMLSYVAFMSIDVTPVTRIRFDYVYSIWILFAGAVIVRSAVLLVRLAGRNWQRETGDAGLPRHPVTAPTE